MVVSGLETCVSISHHLDGNAIGHYVSIVETAHSRREENPREMNSESSSDTQKTDQYAERLHSVILQSAPEMRICPVNTYWELLSLRGRLGIPQEAPIAQYDTYTTSAWHFEDVTRFLKANIAKKEGTPYVRGHLTGHSFRRGFVKLATELGVDPRRVKMHGDWKRMATMQGYAAGSSVVLNMIPLIEWETKV